LAGARRPHAQGHRADARRRRIRSAQAFLDGLIGGMLRRVDAGQHDPLGCAAFCRSRDVRGGPPGMKPAARPKNPQFSSGPCAKRPGWSLGRLEAACVGRSHRSAEGKAKLAEVIDLSRKVLGLPADYRLGIVPGSDTGAVEMALWSLLGARGVDVLAWESFGKGWLADVVQQLKLKDVRSFEADYGAIPDLGQVDSNRDIVFTWNGTTSGVRVPNGD